MKKMNKFFNKATPQKSKPSLAGGAFHQYFNVTQTTQNEILNEAS